MVILRSILSVVDNSGLHKVRRFHIIGKAVGTVGSRRVGSAKKIEPNGEWSRGDVVRGLVVGVKKEMLRNTGIVYKGEANSMLVMNKKWEPLGTRVNATLPKELRKMGYRKVVAIAKIVI